MQNPSFISKHIAQHSHTTQQYDEQNRKKQTFLFLAILSLLTAPNCLKKAAKANGLVKQVPNTKVQKDYTKKQLEQ